MENEEKPNYSTLKEEPVNLPEPPPAYATHVHPFPKFLPKKIAVIIILISGMFLIGLITTIYNLGKNSADNQNPPATVPQSPSPTPDPTADWEIYKSSVYGFVIKYPKNGIIKEYSPGDPAPAVILRIPNSSAALLIHIYNSRINFSTVNDAINYELDSEEKNQTYPSKYIRTNYNNGDINGEKLVSEVNPNTDWNYIHVYSLFKNKIYHFEFRYDDSEDREEMSLLADQIFSTFKFTNSNTTNLTNSNNEFDVANSKIGDVIAGLKITKISSFYNDVANSEDAIIEFSGNVDLEGKYKYELGTICFIPINNPLPILKDSGNSNWFCFDNYSNDLLNQFPKPDGTAKIKIKNYKIKSYPAEIYNTATYINKIN